jgi:glycosyltransferase involved in cell wall biosynthesis
MTHPRSFAKCKTLWVSDTQPLDVFLHKTSLLSIAEAFAQNGNETTLIASKSKNVQRPQNPKMHSILFPLRFRPVFSPILYALTILLFLPLYLLASKPQQVIIEYDISTITALPALAVAKLTKTKFVLDIRSIPVELTGKRGHLHTLKFSASVLTAKRWFDGITILTAPMKQEVCRKFGLQPERVGVWTSGVSQERFNLQNAKESAVLKRSLGLEGKFVVFYHGILTATRGLQQTVEAMNLLKERYEDIVFFALGSGPIAAQLKKLAAEQNLQGHVIVHDAVDQTAVPEFIGMSDVAIVPLPDHPYWNFQSPLKLLEYLAMEKVVVLSQIPAHQNVIGTAHCGIYIRYVEPKEVARAIEYAYQNRDKLTQWGQTGKAIVEQQYTWRKVAEDLEEYLQNQIGN